MYPFILAVHNILRWIVLFLCLLALVRAYWGWFGKKDWTAADRRAGMFYTIALDVQLLLGLLLYFIFSPITTVVFNNFSASLTNPDLRFFAWEHLLVMVAAVVFAHIGSITSRQAAEPTAKHRRAAIWFSLSLAAILVGIPWFRPLLPAF